MDQVFRQSGKYVCMINWLETANIWPGLLIANFKPESMSYTYIKLKLYINSTAVQHLRIYLSSAISFNVRYFFCKANASYVNSCSDIPRTKENHIRRNLGWPKFGKTKSSKNIWNVDTMCMMALSMWLHRWVSLICLNYFSCCKALWGMDLGICGTECNFALAFWTHIFEGSTVASLVRSK